MLKLHGFSASNYYNVVKLALLEKDLPFEEVQVYVGAGARYRPDYLALSPIGKVPCLETEHGYLTESRCIIDYLEATQGGPALYPRDPFARAKMLELTQGIDLYLELQARRLMPYYFAGKPPSERMANEILAELAKGVRVLRARATFDTFLLGDAFTAADLAGVIHLPTIRHVVGKVLGKDPLADLAGVDEYLARLGERPTVQRVRAAQAADLPAFVKHIQALAAAGEWA
jgi:glutathione S-transferase